MSGKLSSDLADEFATGKADLDRVVTLPAVPNPGADLESALKSLRALKAAYDILAGSGSSVLDRALTTRDLIDAGALRYIPSVGLVTSAPTFVSQGTGTGTGGTAGYVDPRPVFTTPPTPTNLVAVGAFRNIILTWNLTDYRNHAYVEVWRNTVDNLGSAALYDTVTSNIYVDGAGVAGPTYYYWVRALNLEGMAGAFNAVGGTPAFLGQDIGETRKLLIGSIAASQLFTDLAAPFFGMPRRLGDAATDALSALVSVHEEQQSRISSVTRLSAEAGGNFAAIQTESSARASLDGSVQALYTVRVEASGAGGLVVGGFGLAATSTKAGGARIDFGVRADRFFIAAPESSGVSSTIVPFIVQTTPGATNGVTVPVGVYIDAAFIQNGSITNAKIGNAVIDDAKIANLSAAKITTGFLDANRIQASSIDATKITVTSLSALSANLGTVTAGTLAAGTVFAGALSAATGTFSGALSAASGTFVGTLTVGTTPARTGTTMTGTGAKFDGTDGTGVWGNATTNLTFNGSVMTMNGAWVRRENLTLGGFTVSIAGGNISQTVAAGVSFGPALIGSRTATASGGSGTITYEWELIGSGQDNNATIYATDAASISSPTISLSATCSSGGNASRVVRVTVRDANGLTSTASFLASITSLS